MLQGRRTWRITWMSGGRSTPSDRRQSVKLSCDFVVLASYSTTTLSSKVFTFFNLLFQLAAFLLPSVSFSFACVICISMSVYCPLVSPSKMSMNSHLCYSSQHILCNLCVYIRLVSLNCSFFLLTDSFAYIGVNNPPRYIPVELI